ncbi:MAG: DUF4430 domain-containing protein [Evtepia gabavorous]
MKASRRNIVIAVVLLAVLLVLPFWPKIRQALAPAAGKEVSCTVTVACQGGGPAGAQGGRGCAGGGWDPVLHSCTVTENSTVLEALKTAAKAAGCPVTTQGSPAYVTAIGDLAAGAHGEASGWTYTVNGEMVMDSCDTGRSRRGTRFCGPM